MTIVLTVRPAPHQGAATPQDSPRLPYADKIVAAYQLAFARYEAKLRGERERLDGLGLGAALTGYPEVEAILYQDEGPQSVAFDFDLFALLVESYVLDGWSGIERLQEVARKLASDEAIQQFDHAISGGKPDDLWRVWVIARQFFEVTRNLVGMLVHEALVAIELKAAKVIETRLDASIGAIEKARKGSLSQSEFSKRHGYFALGDRELARQLFKNMTKLVFELTRVKRYAGARDAARKYAQPERTGAAEDRGQGGAEGGTGRIDATKYAERLREEEASLAHAEAAFAAASKVVHAASPLALLALARIEEGFTAAQMEQAIDAGLTERAERCNELKAAVASGESRVAATWPRPPLYDAPGAEQLEAIAQWTIPPGGHVAAAASTVLGKIGMLTKAGLGDLGWLPLAREDILHELVDGEALDPETFEYPVYFHYASAWIAALQADIEMEQKVNEALTGLWQVVAFASIVATKSPSAIESTPVRLLLLGVMSHTFFKGLATLNDAIQAELIGSDHLSAEKLALSAKLEAEQDEFVKDFARRVALDLVLGMGAKHFLTIRLAVLTRNYYSDAQTLLDAPSDGE